MQTVFLIGDAGERSAPGSDPLKAITAQARALRESSIIFLGDNLYPAGVQTLQDDDPANCPLNAEVDAVRDSQAVGVFVPGNHDWDNMASTGETTLRNEEAFVRAKHIEQLFFLPAAGTPVAHKQLGAHLHLVAIDTQWWVRSWHDRSDTEHARALVDLKATVAGSAFRPMLIVAHHPFATHGEHGGFLDWRGWIFPLTALELPWPLQYAVPLPGVQYLSRHLYSVDDADMWAPSYRRTREVLEPIIRDARSLFYAAGHDHSLQVLSEPGYLQLVSGAGTTGTTGHVVGTGDDTLFASAQAGFMRLDMTRDNRARLGVWIVAGPGDHATEAFSMFLPVRLETSDAEH